MFVLFALFVTNCANWKQGSTLAFYQGAILDFDGPGRDRLAIEAKIDSTVRDYLARNGNPDFVYVAGLRDIEVIYVGRDTLVHFHRSIARGFSPDFDWHSTATEVHPLPEAFLNLLPAIGLRVRQVRGQ